MPTWTEIGNVEGVETLEMETLEGADCTKTENVQSQDYLLKVTRINLWR